MATVLILSSGARATHDETLASEGGTGVGAAVVTLIYTPLKLAYALGGIVLSGLTLLWTRGDTEVASTIARVSTNGDYVVTPSHLRRQEDLDFDGG